MQELRLDQPRMIGVATYPAGASFGPRRLPDYEFVWVIEGAVEYHCDRGMLAAPPGSIILCRSGDIDFFQFDRTQRTRHGYVHFTVHSVPTDWPSPADWPVVRPAQGDDLLHQLFRYLLTWASNGDALQRELTLAQLLTAFISGQTAIGEAPRQALPAAVERAHAYLHERLEREPNAPIHLADLAAAAGVNREHLCRLFATSTGRSPMETVRLTRLDRAAELLARSNYMVSEIATIAGFSSPYHFSRRFKEAFGAAPRDYRRRIQAGEPPPVPLLAYRVFRAEAGR